MTARGTRSLSASHSPGAVRPDMQASEAIRALVDRAGGRLHGLARRLCKNGADADDMIQDVFLQAFRKWHTFRGDADPMTWLYAIAVRSCRLHAARGRSRVRRTRTASDLMPWGETTVLDVASDEDSPHAKAVRREAVEAVQAHIADLPEHLRLPIILKEVLELDVDDTAAALGIAANTVKTRLHRGRLALRKAMTAAGVRRRAPAPRFDKRVCIDLLRAKMESMDRGASHRRFAVPQAEFCARCRHVFHELDLVQDACRQFGGERMPAALRQRIVRAVRELDDSRPSPASRRRGRPPVRA